PDALQLVGLEQAQRLETELEQRELPDNDTIDAGRRIDSQTVDPGQVAERKLVVVLLRIDADLVGAAFRVILVLAGPVDLQVGGLRRVNLQFGVADRHGPKGERKYGKPKRHPCQRPPVAPHEAYGPVGKTSRWPRDWRHD